MTDRRSARVGREEGSALFVAVLMLVLMGWLGLASMDTATRDRQVAGFQNRSKAAFYAAEAGAAQGRSLVRTVTGRNDTPVLAQSFLGDAALYDRETQLPQYFGDPAFAPNFVQYMDEGGVAAGMNLGGKAKFVNTFWRINVMGQSPGPAGGIGSSRASTARIEVVETKVLSQGY